jgi:hypothetical protein
MGRGLMRSRRLIETDELQARSVAGAPGASFNHETGGLTASRDDEMRPTRNVGKSASVAAPCHVSR